MTAAGIHSSVDEWQRIEDGLALPPADFIPALAAAIGADADELIALRKECLKRSPCSLRDEPVGDEADGSCASCGETHSGETHSTKG